MSVNLMHEVIEDCKRRQKCLDDLNVPTKEHPAPVIIHKADETDWTKWVGAEKYLELVKRLTVQSKILLDMHARGEQLGNPPRPGTDEFLAVENPIVNDETEEALGSIQKDRFPAQRLKR